MAVEEQLTTLRNCLSIQMRSVLKNTVEWMGDTTVHEVITTIHANSQAQRHQIHVLVEFYERNQEEAETFASFLCALQEIAVNCDLEKTTVDHHFIIRILTGIPDPDIRWKLLAKPDLDLKSAIVSCRQEAAGKKADMMVSGTHRTHLKSVAKKAFRINKPVVY